MPAFSLKKSKVNFCENVLWYKKEQKWNPRFMWVKRGIEQKTWRKPGTLCLKENESFFGNPPLIPLFHSAWSLQSYPDALMRKFGRYDDMHFYPYYICILFKHIFLRGKKKVCYSHEAQSIWFFNVSLEEIFLRNLRLIYCLCCWEGLSMWIKICILQFHFQWSFSTRRRKIVNLGYPGMTFKYPGVWRQWPSRMRNWHMQQFLSAGDSCLLLKSVKALLENCIRYV